jgi:hypothetical protein
LSTALFLRAAALAVRVQTAVGSKKLADFVAALERPSAAAGSAVGFAEEVASLRSDVERFASAFPMPGPLAGGPLP